MIYKFTLWPGINYLAAVIVMIALFGPHPANAFSIGDTVFNIFRIDGKDVPLPSGPHKIIEIGFVDITYPEKSMVKIEPADFGPVRRVVLARFDDGLVVDVVEVISNTLPYPDGWGIASECSRTDIYATLTRYKSGWDVSCLWVQPLTTTQEQTLLTETSIRKLADQSAVVVPTFWIESGFRIANRQDLIDVRYRFAGLIDGTAASAVNPSLWHPAEIEKQTERLEFVQAVAVWASNVYPSLETGLRQPLPSDLAFSRPNGEIADRISDRDRRLVKLSALRDTGVIDEVEFLRQEAIIQAEKEPALESSWTYASVAGYKAATYRVVVTILNVGIDYVFIGQPFAAGVLVILQVFVNTTKFFFHEVMWQELFGVGPLGRDNPRVLDFVAIPNATSP